MQVSQSDICSRCNDNMIHQNREYNKEITTRCNSVITLCFINIYDVITYSITLQDFGILILNDGKNERIYIGTYWKFFSPTSNPHSLLLMYQIGKFLQIGIRLQVLVTLMARFKKASDSIGGNGGSKMQVAQRARLQKGGIQGILILF